MVELTDKLGPGAIASDFPVEDLTPSYDDYEDDDEVTPSAPAEEIEPTPEANRSHP